MARVTIKHGNPLSPNSMRRNTFDTTDQVEAMKVGLNWIWGQLSIHPWRVRKGYKVSDGLNIYEIVRVEGPVLRIGAIYPGQYPPDTEPVEILTFRLRKGVLEYKCRVGYSGRTQDRWLNQRQVLNYLTKTGKSWNVK